MIVLGPANPVAVMDRKALLFEQREAIVLLAGADAARAKASHPALGIAKPDLAGFGVDAFDLVFAPW